MRKSFIYFLSYLVFQSSIPLASGAYSPGIDNPEKVARIGVVFGTDAQGRWVPECEFAAFEAAPLWLNVDSGPSRLKASHLQKCSAQTMSELAPKVAKFSMNRQAGLQVAMGSFMCLTVAVASAYLKIRDARMTGTMGMALGTYTSAIATANYMNSLPGSVASFTRLLGGLAYPVACHMVGEGFGEAYKSVAYIWERI